MDLATAATLLALFAPLMLLTAGFIKFTSRGPVFYRQVRCGLYGRRFSLMKFRTMIDGAEDRLWEIKHLNEMNGPVFKMRNDPRVTPLGRFLRKYSIDEIPQLWNVLKGEMSIVGPRAPLGEEVRYYSIRQRRRLSVKPGITCLWQVSGRSDIDFHRWMDMDLYYIDNWSLWLDFRILLKTIPAVFTGRGAR
jgi:lipopolysaccharide/colanic/teichoic acid biosynthesis glycosyltransferase